MSHRFPPARPRHDHATHQPARSAIEPLEHRRLLAVVGYYDIPLGQGDDGGSLNQKTVIEAAGHTALKLTTLSPSELAQIDVLSTRHYGTTTTVYRVTAAGQDPLEFINALPDIHSAVADGLVWLMEDMLPHTGSYGSPSQPIGPHIVLPGAGSISFASSILAGVPRTNVDFVTTGTLVSAGPAGTLGNTSLDHATQGVFEGHAIGASLPAGATTVLKSTGGDHVPTVTWAHGDGRVIFSGMVQRNRIGGLPSPLDVNLGIYQTNLHAYAGSFTNAAPVWTLAPDAQVQFSDALTAVTYAAADADNDTITAEIVAGLPPGSGISFDWDDQTNTGTLSGTAASLAPGDYTLTLRVTDDAGAFSDEQITLTVTEEDAHAGYSGLYYVATPTLADSTATVMLRATVLDAFRVASFGDATPASLAGATVNFHNLTTGDTISSVPIVPMDATDPTAGVAAAPYDVTLLPEQDSVAHVWRIEVQGTHTFQSGATVVTVSRPDEGRIAGGGAIANGDSAGTLAAAAGTKTEFSLNAKRNKHTGAIDGNIGLIIPSHMLPNGSVSATLQLYSVQSTQVRSLDTFTVDGVKRAAIAADVEIWNITDALNPVLVAGGLRLEMTLAQGNRGVGRAAFTIWGSAPSGQSNLWFSNDWNGTSTDEQTLSEGNINVLNVVL